jgi:hypothetical protein
MTSMRGDAMAHYELGKKKPHSAACHMACWRRGCNHNAGRRHSASVKVPTKVPLRECSQALNARQVEGPYRRVRLNAWLGPGPIANGTAQNHEEEQANKNCAKAKSPTAQNIGRDALNE